MNLLDSASLVLTPNGYKASKLYSLIPADGSGDLSVSRAGDTATRVNSSNVIESVLANKPRLDYTDGSCPKVLIEPQRTNLVIRSNEFDNAFWDKSNGVTISANFIASPDGTTNADRYASSSGVISLMRGSIYSLTISSVYTASIFVKKSNYRYLGYKFITNDYLNYNFYDFDTNTVNNTKDTYPIKIQNYPNGWVRLSITGPALATASAFDIAQVNSNGSIYTYPTGTEQFYVYGAQVEAGESASSYIPTTSATVTRNGDTLSKTGISSLINSVEGTLSLQIQALANYNDFKRISLSDGTNNNKISIGYNTTNQIQVVVSIGGSIIILFNVTATIINNTKIAFRYKSANYALFINGVKVSTSTSSSAFSASVLTGIYFADGDNGLKYDGKLSNLSLWKTALSDSELITLTT
jgi:hypothetical protein